MKIIGLTGGFATGKTTVSQMIREMGHTVICADEIAHTLVSHNSQILNQIISLFGKDYLDMNQNLDRKKLASVLFQKFFFFFPPPPIKKKKKKKRSFF